MKLRVLFILGLLFLLRFGIHSSVFNECIYKSNVVDLSWNDIPFDILTAGDNDDHRSIVQFPIWVIFDNESHFVELEFTKAIGEIEIKISHDSDTIFSFSENVLFPMQKEIQLPSDLCGEYHVEIRADNGAYVFGSFYLN